MSTTATSGLEGAALAAWRSFLQSHALILRELDADLLAEQGMTTRDYQVLLYLSKEPNRKLAMSALAERTMLTRSGITRLVDGLVAGGLIERVSCPSDARVSYAALTDTGYEKLRQAGCTHIAGIQRLFLEHFCRGDRAARDAAQPPARRGARRFVHGRGLVHRGRLHRRADQRDACAGAAARAGTRRRSWPARAPRSAARGSAPRRDRRWRSAARA